MFDRELNAPDGAALSLRRLTFLVPGGAIRVAQLKSGDLVGT
ncbi:hypothetical protein [Mycobacterium sp. AT1]|nr:hypothetical protein [Mycobacterium sp. AT1]